jgi:hypothetical protein
MAGRVEQVKEKSMATAAKQASGGTRLSWLDSMKGFYPVDRFFILWHVREWPFFRQR